MRPAPIVSLRNPNAPALPWSDLIASRHCCGLRIAAMPVSATQGVCHPVEN